MSIRRRTSFGCTAYDDAGRKNAGKGPVAKSAGRSWVIHEQKPAIDDYAPLGSFGSLKLCHSSKRPPARTLSASSASPDIMGYEPLPFFRPARPAAAENAVTTLKTGRPNFSSPVVSTEPPSAVTRLADAVTSEAQPADKTPKQLRNNNFIAGKVDHHPQAFLSKYEITKSYIGEGSTCYVMEVKLRPARGIDRVLDCISESEVVEGKDSVESSSVGDKANNHQTSDDDESDEGYAACKVITAKMSRENVLKELEMLEQLSSHRRILQLRDVFWSDRRDIMCYVITSLARGGNLQDKVEREGHSLDEKAAKTVMRQVLEGVAFMHGKGIVHRDLKLSNVVIKTVASKGSETPEPEYQIADFGMSKYLLSQDGGSFGKHTICGSPSCIAPEILECPHVCELSGKTQAQYGRKVDVWSCGVMLFTLLSGKQPFTGKGIGDLFRCIKAGEINMAGPIWATVSEEAKDFVRLLLTSNPAERPTADEALAHTWMATDHLHVMSPSQ